MNAKYWPLVCSVLLFGCTTDRDNDHDTPFEQSNGTETTTYEACIEWWKTLDNDSPYVRLTTFGQTDAGEPLHVVVVNPRKNFIREKIQSSGQNILLINNGIHPGEPDGIDASMMLVRDLIAEEDYANKYDNLVLYIIPVYNVGGSMNRGCCSRANQNGPLDYGFRGNARNLDLNRDFVKCDSKNAQAFSQLFTNIDPDIYLETHVSNGADYPYTMTYISGQSDKLGEPLGTLLREEIDPILFNKMKADGDEMIPYVNVFGHSPDSGYATFYDSPRYSTGYAALHHSIGMLTETHMLKPFDQRVLSTLRFMRHLVHTTLTMGPKIQEARNAALQSTLDVEALPIDWKIDSALVRQLPFKGFKAYYDTSKVTGLPQLYYDQEQTWEREIPYYDRMKATTEVDVPSYYLVPAAWSEVVDRLRWNNVEMMLIERDTLVEVQAYEIEEFDTPPRPFEGHYVYSNTTVTEQFWSKSIAANQYYLISTQQNKRRFLVELLEPTAPDSYFNWNFYDEILQQKEWFSSYVFDQKAEELLKDSAIRRAFEQQRAEDPHFADNAFSQLYYLYRNSAHYERERHMIYPVFRIP